MMAWTYSTLPPLCTKRCPRCRADGLYCCRGCRDTECPLHETGVEKVLPRWSCSLCSLFSGSHRCSRSTGGARYRSPNAARARFRCPVSPSSWRSGGRAEPGRWGSTSVVRPGRFRLGCRDCLESWKVCVKDGRLLDGRIHCHCTSCWNHVMKIGEDIPNCGTEIKVDTVNIEGVPM